MYSADELTLDEFLSEDPYYQLQSQQEYFPTTREPLVFFPVDESFLYDYNGTNEYHINNNLSPVQSTGSPELQEPLSMMSLYQSSINSPLYMDGLSKSPQILNDHHHHYQYNVPSRYPVDESPSPQISNNHHQPLSTSPQSIPSSPLYMDGLFKSPQKSNDHHFHYLVPSGYPVMDEPKSPQISNDHHHFQYNVPSRYPVDEPKSPQISNDHHHHFQYNVPSRYPVDEPPSPQISNNHQPLSTSPQSIPSSPLFMDGLSKSQLISNDHHHSLNYVPPRYPVLEEPKSPQISNDHQHHFQYHYPVLDEPKSPQISNNHHHFQYNVPPIPEEDSDTLTPPKTPSPGWRTPPVRRESNSLRSSTRFTIMEFPPPPENQSEHPRRPISRSLSLPTISSPRENTTRKRPRTPLDTPKPPRSPLDTPNQSRSPLSSKINKKHDSTPVEDFIKNARTKNNFNETGMIYYEGLMAYDESKFFQWVRSQKGSDYRNIKQTSFYEKFNKSRPVNRLDPTVRFGPIKFLKIDKGKCRYTKVIQLIEEIENIYSPHKFKYLTYRDWNLLPLEEFVYSSNDNRK